MRQRVREGAPRKVVAWEFRRSFSAVCIHTRGVRSGVPTGEQEQILRGLRQRAERAERLFGIFARALEEHP